MHGLSRLLSMGILVAWIGFGISSTLAPSAEAG